MRTKELLKKARVIEIKTRRLSENMFGGEYHSTFKGQGMTFSEVRRYQFGDDVRNIDWNVTARYNEPYIKVFEEERELTMMLLIDCSGSQFFGTQNQSKHDIATEIAATLAFSALKNNDKVGVIFFSDKIEHFIPPKKGKTHILRIIRDLVNFRPTSDKTDVAHALEYFTSIIKRQAIAFVISDFMAPPYHDTLKIVAKKHDLTGIRLYDVRESEMPNIGMVQFKDLETNTYQTVNTASKRIRKEYKKAFYENIDYFQNAFTQSGAGTINCSVDESYVKKLLAYFKQK